jgi:hypothetical protein
MARRTPQTRRPTVNVDARIEQLFEAITTGDRERAIAIVSLVRQDGLTAE